MLSAKTLRGWQVDLSLGTDDVNLTNCDREPIHIPSSIQPHGVLLVLRESDLQILQVSANVQEFLNLSTDQLLGTSLDQWFTKEQVEKLHSCMEQDFDSINPLRFHEPSTNRAFNGIAHRSGKAIVLELEPTQQGLTPMTNTIF